MAANTIKTRLQEITPSRPSRLRETLGADASPGIDSPAEKQEVAFWESILATLDQHGHDYRGAVQALRTSASEKIKAMTEATAASDYLARVESYRNPGRIRSRLHPTRPVSATTQQTLTEGVDAYAARVASYR
ncbi:hypothetical protein [Botrimarina mediterranea]|uniref:hypothetical protein n=1 Tax=Botrimarina mediterranea TaxID=2528022 RepID=UPI001188DD4F|nr:hypothetical protein K2D_34830 [Planctomycetes bacterium K2D]